MMKLPKGGHPPMMIEKSGTIRLRDIPVANRLSPEEQELATGMVRVTHL